MSLRRRPSLSALLTLAILCLVLSGCASREERIADLRAEANEAVAENDTETAIEILRKGLAKYPDSNALRIELSQVVQSAGDLQEAAALLEAAIKQDPDLDRLWVRIGELRARSGQSEDALRAFDAYLKNHAEDFLAWKAITLENEKLGKLTDAIKAASKWNAISPSSQPALKLGQLYQLSRNIPQARSWLSQAAAYKDNYAAKEALAELIQLETNLKQLNQAKDWLATYDARYGSAAEDARIQNAKQIIKRWEIARAELAAQAAALERERSELEEKRLAEERAAANAQSAALQRSLQTPTSTPNASAPVASTTGEATVPATGETSTPASTRPPRALFDDDTPSPAPATAAPAPATSQPDIAQTASEALEAGNYAAAVAAYWELLGEDPENAETWFNLSRAYYAQKNWLDAESTILEAKRRAPRSEVVANQYLLTLRETHNLTQFVEEAKAMRRLFPRSPEIPLTLARTLRDSKSPRSFAIAAYSDFLNLAGRNHPAREEAQQFLSKR